METPPTDTSSSLFSSSTSSEVSDSVPTNYVADCSFLREDGYVMIEDRACQVVSIAEGEGGLLHISAIDLFSGDRYEVVWPPNRPVEIPSIYCAEFEAIRVDSRGFVELMNDVGVVVMVRFVADEIRNRIIEALERQEIVVCEVVSHGDQEAISNIRMIKPSRDDSPTGEVVTPMSLLDPGS